MERRVHMVPWKTYLKGKVAVKSDTLPMRGLIYSISRSFRISTSRPLGLITLVADPGPTFEAKVLVGPLKSPLLLPCYPNISATFQRAPVLSGIIVSCTRLGEISWFFASRKQTNFFGP